MTLNELAPFLVLIAFFLMVVILIASMLFYGAWYDKHHKLNQH